MIGFGSSHHSPTGFSQRLFSPSLAFMVVLVCCVFVVVCDGFGRRFVVVVLLVFCGGSRRNLWHGIILVAIQSLCFSRLYCSRSSRGDRNFFLDWFLLGSVEFLVLAVTSVLHIRFFLAIDSWCYWFFLGFLNSFHHLRVSLCLQFFFVQPKRKVHTTFVLFTCHYPWCTCSLVLGLLIFLVWNLVNMTSVSFVCGDDIEEPAGCFFSYVGLWCFVVVSMVVLILGLLWWFLVVMLVLAGVGFWWWCSWWLVQVFGED